jgi:hypothetical protein
MTPFRKYIVLLHKLRNAEHFGFFEYNVDFIAARQSAIADIKPLWDAFHDLFTKEDTIFKRSQKAEETKPIREAHTKMKNTFMTIKRITEAASYTDDPVQKAAADRLDLVMKNYKQVPSAPMNEASALVINMVQDLLLPVNAPSVTALSLGTYVDKLDEYNSIFRELYFARAQERESLAEQGTMKEIRSRVDEAFALFTDTLGGIYTVALSSGQASKAASLKEIIDSINAIILQYEHIYARRTGRSISDNVPDVPAGGGIPSLAVAAQTVPLKENNGGPVMEVVMSDVQAFAGTLYPAALDAYLLIRKEGDEGEFYSLPIQGFVMEGEGPDERPVGLKVGPRAGTYPYWYESPFQDEGPAEARVVKDDLDLAFFTGMQYPVMYRNT